MADRLVAGMPDESQARAFVGLAARTLCGSLLVRFAPPAVADAFCASRLAPRFSGSYGDLPPGVDAAAIVERALPECACPSAARPAPRSRPITLPRPAVDAPPEVKRIVAIQPATRSARSRATWPASRTW